MTAHGRVGPSGVMATSQGLPSWDLVVASGEVPSRFVRPFDGQHTPEHNRVHG
jgi:hypothetical protein